MFYPIAAVLRGLNYNTEILYSHFFGVISGHKCLCTSCTASLNVLVDIFLKMMCFN